jgi:hypothetical protein
MLSPKATVDLGQGSSVELLSAQNALISAELNAVSWVLNSISKQDEITKPEIIFLKERPVAVAIKFGSGFLTPLRFKEWGTSVERDIAKYPTTEALNELLKDDPYKCTDRSPYCLLRFPIVRADELLTHGLSPNSYVYLSPAFSGSIHSDGSLTDDKISFIELIKYWFSSYEDKRPFENNSPSFLRAVFSSSFVSANNRVIDRYVYRDKVNSRSLGIWRSYDFASRNGPGKDPVSTPLGFGSSENNFDYHFSKDGGEWIVVNRNGLQSYGLSNKDDVFVPVGPTNIVFHSGRNEPISLGYSCFTCHAFGIIPLHSEVTNDYESTKVFPNIVASKVRNLFLPQTEIEKQVSKDNYDFNSAKRQAFYSEDFMWEDLIGTLVDFY